MTTKVATTNLYTLQLIIWINRDLRGYPQSFQIPVFGFLRSAHLGRVAAFYRRSEGIGRWTGVRREHQVNTSPHL